jgi:cell wall-associated NlpC family hydrolase
MVRLASRLTALLMLVSLSAVGCASTGARPQPFPMPERRPPATQPDAASSPAPDEVSLPTAPLAVSIPIVDVALELRGVPYRNGGTDPSGFDCSGFTQFVFGRFELPLPREVRDQYRHGRGVSRRESRPGDLVFFSTVASGASHVGIIVDADRFVHAPSSTGVVRVESMDSRYWRDRFVGIRRIVPD